MSLQHYNKVVLCDSETGNWRLGRKHEFTRLIQFAIYEDGVRLSEHVIELHPEKTTSEDLVLMTTLRELADGNALFIFQHAQYDLPRLAKLGIHIERFRDTKILSQLVYCGYLGVRHSLNNIMQRELGFDPYEDISRDAVNQRMIELNSNQELLDEVLKEVGQKNAMGEIMSTQEALEVWRSRELAATKKRLQGSDWEVADLTPDQLTYARMDVSHHFYEVWRRLEIKIQINGMDRVAEMEHQLIPAVVEMEENGIKMHMDKWDQYLLDTAKKLDDIEAQLKAIIDPWTQDLYPEKFMVTLRRKKPKEGKPAKVKKDGTVTREAVPAQLVGDLSAVQPTPELTALVAPCPALLAMQDGDYRVGSVVRAELGLSQGPQFNMNSAQQMRSLVNDMLKLDWRDSEGEPKEGMLKFAEGDVNDLAEDINLRMEDADGLESMVLAQVKNMLELHLKAQELRKILSTYAESYQSKADEFGYIRSHFETVSTFTGRMTSSDPNLQNLPRDMQALLFVCEEWEAMVSVDYSNMEGRTLFFVTGQEDIYDKLTDGMDLHSLSMSFMLGRPYESLVERLPGEIKDTVLPQFKAQRQKAKAVTFAPMFGAYPKRISKLIGCSFAEAKAFLARYWSTYQITKAALDRQFSSAVNCGYITDLSFGRKRFFVLTPEQKGRIAKGEERIDVCGAWRTESYNYAAQAGGASCLKVALIMLHTWIKRHPETKIKLRLVVHDSIKVTCDPSYAVFVGNEIKRIMECAAEVVLGGACVPADVEIYHDHKAPRTFHRNQQTVTMAA